MKKIIWLFGENESKTMNNNSYYFFSLVSNNNDEISKYFILKKTIKNIILKRKIQKNIKKKIIWKNSFKHWYLFLKSNLLLVTLSYKDVTPNKLLFKNIKIRPRTQVVYLQHGTLAIKKIGYHGKSYNNKMFRFFVYNEEMMDVLVKENKFKPYQLYYAKYHPRYMELIKQEEKLIKNQILYFLTWREYLGNNKETEKLKLSLKDIVTNKLLIKYLKENKLTFKICLHQFFSKNILKEINSIIDNSIFKITSNIDVLPEIARSKLLITDYSSLGFDFTFLKKPVILYAIDNDIYFKYRDTYCSKEEFNEYLIQDKDKLINIIINEEYKINDFFRKRLPKKIDYDYIKNGKHIKNMYNYLKEKSLNKITFIGYKFGGCGGTVSATKSLANKLLERGYLVELISLSGTLKNRSSFPEGLNEISLMRKNKRIYARVYEKILQILSKDNIIFGPIKYDSCHQKLVSTISYRINKYLKNTTAKTIVSTRESIHPYLSKINNKNIKNKIFFFHTDADSFNLVFSKLDTILEKCYLDKCVFVSKNNLIKYQNKFKLNIGNYKVIGNTIESDKIISKEKITIPKKKDKYLGICLTRLSEDRKKDLDNIIEFAIFLKQQSIKNILINIYGKGTLKKYLENEIIKNKLNDYLVYSGYTNSVFEEIKKHDFLVDFSHSQSFGMIYIEGILAGKKVYALKNGGSKEVLADIDNSIYTNKKELLNYLKKIDTISLQELQNNYDLIMAKYGNNVIIDKFLDYLCN